MAWRHILKPDYAKKAALKYLLQRYLGHFVEDGELSLDQLSLDLFEGTGCVTNVTLDPQALNEFVENFPLEFVAGHVKQISVSIPWTAMLSKGTFIEITGLKLTIQPRQRPDIGTSMFDSVWKSTSIIQMAQECAQQSDNNEVDTESLDGVELFAKTIDQIFSKIKVRFIKTVIRLEHMPMDSTTGVATEVHIDNLEYFDEAGSDPTTPPADYTKSTKETREPKEKESKDTEKLNFIIKCFYFEGVSFHTDEFPARDRTFSKNVTNSSRGSTPDSKNSEGQFSSAQISPMQTPPEKHVTSNLHESTLIMFAKLFGRQEVGLKIKRDEGLVGPKVEVSVDFGPIALFLSPRQVHVLIELMRGLASPDTEDVSNVMPKHMYGEKRMAPSDFNRVERELANQLNPLQGLRTMDLRHTQGWSTGSLDDSDNEDEFLPMRPAATTSMNTSITSNVTSMDGSFSGSTGSSKNSFTGYSKQRKYRNNIDTDPLTETIKFGVSASSLAIILLHEDILTVSFEAYGPTKASTTMMKTVSENFFKKLLTSPNYGNRDFEKLREVFANICQYSHLRLLAAPLIIDGNQKSTAKYSGTSGNLLLANFELVEILIDNTSSNDASNSTMFIDLLTFPKNSTSNAALLNRTNVEMKFHHTQKAFKRNQMTIYTHPRTEFNITLAPCQCEFDITIIDRISNLLNMQPICVSSPASAATRGNINRNNLFHQAVESPSLPDSRIDIKVSATKCDIVVRFPVPDLRPLHDLNRVPWWKRSVRSDYMTLHLTDGKLHTSIESRLPYVARHEVQCRRLFISYTEVDSDTPIILGKATADEYRTDDSLHNEGEGFGWPRMVIIVYPQNVGVPLDDSSDGEAEHSSLDDTLESTPRQQPSPFSSKRIIHESDTPHSRPQNPHDHNSKETREGEELIIPGNRKEMMEFIEEGTRNCRIQLEIGLPCASVQIPSKHLYELIYNRINTDLLLWEPSAPRPKYMQHAEANIGLDFASTMLQDSGPQKFSMCKSAIQASSESDSEDEVYQSVTSKVGHRAKYGSTLKNGQSKVALTLTINQGILTIFTPVRDSLRNVIPGQQGEIIIRVDDFILFSVTNYKGDENLGYVCMISKDVTLYHCDLITMPPSPPSLRSINSMIPKHCLRTIYRNEPGANLSTNYIEKDMLVVAIRIQSAHETHRIKTFRVAVGISQATLRHKVCTSQTLWFTQLTDCLDVIDHPVSGYTPPGVLTELHVHLWECAIDYRPIHLPLRSMISLGSFSISSNIAAQTNTSTLGFIAEDIAFFISDKMGKLVDLKHDYVCVMDLGLFELSLRLNEKMINGAPRFDLRASNNVLHIRTCSDSARALMQLLTYFASDGDLASNCGSTESITVPSSEDGESLLGEESISLLSRSQVERVYSLIDEAMEETEKAEPTEKTKGSSQQPIQSAEFAHPDEWDDFVQSGQFEQPELIGNSQQTAEKKKKEEMFFFPDENNVAKQDSKQAHASSLSDYGDTDDEFCILGEEAGVGIMPQGGVPEVRWLCQESLRIVDNYFSVPLGKTDPLKAPANFPPAVLRYTLCEMTLIWQMYGGKDFGDSQPVAKKHITINENPVYYYGRSRSATETTNCNQASPNRIYCDSMPNSPLARNKESSNDWMKRGGPGRRQDIRMDLQLNKVRFQHEVYPDNTHEASRQILLINQIEVTDKLKCSDINKFLYQYSSEAKPRQSHASMFTMKAVHVRPDPKLTVQECCLKLSLLPVRLNIDQDSLLFLIQYFTELTGGFKQTSDNTTMPNNMQSAPGSKHGTPTHHPPVMSVNDDSDDVDSNVDETDMETNLMLVFEDEFTVKENKSSSKTISESQENSQPVYFRIVPKSQKKRPNLQSDVIFFRSVIFSPEVLIRLDYVGKHVDLTWGPLEGLLLGLARLNCSELKLKRLAHRHGLLGFDKLMSYLFSEWIQDIKKNQLPSILGGVGPMYSLVQLFQGIRDLFWMPIEQYQKDGRIVRGLQRGANSFTTSSAMAALELTSRLVYALQSTAETAYDMVSPGPSVRCKAKGQKGRRKRYNQPIDIREGMSNAYHLVKEGLGETATQLVRVANEEHEQKGVSGAVGGVLRQIPPTVVKPIILATEATNNVLTGMVSQLVPDARHEASQKWRQEDVHDIKPKNVFLSEEDYLE